MLVAYLQRSQVLLSGKLICSGKAEQSTDLVSTCSSLKKNGLSVNGFYLTKVPPNTPYLLQYADFQDSTEDEVSFNYCRLTNRYVGISLILG